MNKESIFALGTCMIFSLVMAVYALSLNDLAFVIFWGAISILFLIIFSSVVLHDALVSGGEQ